MNAVVKELQNMLKHEVREMKLRLIFCNGRVNLRHRASSI